MRLSRINRLFISMFMVWIWSIYLEKFPKTVRKSKISIKDKIKLDHAQLLIHIHKHTKQVAVQKLILSHLQIKGICWSTIKSKRSRNDIRKERLKPVILPFHRHPGAAHDTEVDHKTNMAFTCICICTYPRVYLIMTCQFTGKSFSIYN
jgi:hypothetical protein